MANKNGENRKASRAIGRSSRFLEREGYQVLRSAGPARPISLIAFRHEEILLVQVRAGAWPSPNERDEIRQFPAPVFCVRRQIHRWDDWSRRPRVWELTRRV